MTFSGAVPLRKSPGFWKMSLKRLYESNIPWESVRTSEVVWDVGTDRCGHQGGWGRVLRA